MTRPHQHLRQRAGTAKVLVLEGVVEQGRRRKRGQVGEVGAGVG
jgi:hypothetical protein